MVGERRKKRPAANRGSRPSSRKGARSGGSRSTPTGSRERRKKSGKARAVQLSVAKDDRYQALTTEAYANERHDSPTPGETVGRGPIVSADGRYLAVSLDTAKVIATPYQVKEPREAAE